MLIFMLIFESHAIYIVNSTFYSYNIVLRHVFGSVFPIDIYMKIQGSNMIFIDFSRRHKYVNCLRDQQS